MHTAEKRLEMWRTDNSLLLTEQLVVSYDKKIFVGMGQGTLGFWMSCWKLLTDQSLPLFWLLPSVSVKQCWEWGTLHRSWLARTQAQSSKNSPYMNFRNMKGELIRKERLSKCSALGGLKLWKRFPSQNSSYCFLIRKNLNYLYCRN